MKPAQLLVRTVVFTLALVFLTGCASTGVFNAANLTNVELSGDNYRVVATNVYGEASAAYLLGFSVAQRGEMQTLALIPLGGNRLLFKTALENLWANFAEAHGSVEGRSLALVNVRFDSDAQNVLFFYTKPTISVRADVVEFYK